MPYKKQQEETVEKALHEISFDELEEIRRRAIESVKNKKHVWKQKGPWIECQSCDYKHGHFVGVDKIMKGIDEDGNPFFEMRGKD